MKPEGYTSTCFEMRRIPTPDGPLASSAMLRGGSASLPASTKGGICSNAIGRSTLVYQVSTWGTHSDGDKHGPFWEHLDASFSGLGAQTHGHERVERERLPCT